MDLLHKREDQHDNKKEKDHQILIANELTDEFLNGWKPQKENQCRICKHSLDKYIETYGNDHQNGMGGT